MAKIFGVDIPGWKGDWVKYPSEQFIEITELQRKTMSRQSTCRRIAEDVIDAEKLEQVGSIV